MNPALLAPRAVEKLDLGGGAFVLRCPEPLQPHARCVGEWLEHWAVHTPAAIAFAEPAAETDIGGGGNGGNGSGGSGGNGGNGSGSGSSSGNDSGSGSGGGSGSGWNTLSWAELRQQVGAVAQALLDLALPEGKPVVVLSDNALHHLVLLLAGMHVGRAVCTVSSGYCRLAGGDFSRIHGILQALDPALVYARDAATYAPALVGAGVRPVQLYSQGAESSPGALPFSDLLATPETPAVMAAFAQITPDTHAKYLLTSGSTGHPKVVINTHRMLCANQQMLAQTLRFLDAEKPVLLDWLPWSHTFGGNHNTHLVLRAGGTMYIDDGRPLPGAIGKTLQHLHDVQPTVYFNVPRGFEMMLPALEADEALARRFFGRLRMAFYAGAGMPVTTWNRLVAACAKVRQEPLWLTTSWGSTETAPAAAFVNWRLEGPGVIGLPLPGVELKFIPNGNKLEMRVRGANVFPGYRHNPAATAAAFDKEGYYCIGDAGHLADEADALQGIVFNGRVAEDFKLSSGTWVNVGTLRLKVVAAMAPCAQDAVITGHDRSEIGVLVFLTEAGRALPPEQAAAHVRQGLRALKAEQAGSSQTPARALILDGAPSVANGEITDKGYVNQRWVLQGRASEVEALYAPGGGPRIITP